MIVPVMRPRVVVAPIVRPMPIIAPVMRPRVAVGVGVGVGGGFHSARAVVRPAPVVAVRP